MSSPNQSEISDWLTSIGLPEFVDAFTENGVDMSLLPELSSADLIELGVSRLVDRKRIIKEIGQLSVEKAQATLERRIISVFFCDMVGSTARSTQVDPEELRYELKLYQDTVVLAVNEFGGFVPSFAGDGVMAYFGWPHASEDQATMAVRAALDSIRRVKELEFFDGFSPQCRVGIATGRVVVGGQDDVNSAFGETPNLAARLQGLAEIDQIVIDTSTQKSLARGFQTELLTQADLKGFDQLVSAWKVTGENSQAQNLEAASSDRSKFVGRDAEMAQLNAQWHAAQQSNGGAILLRGEPGIGKSRLTQHFLQNSLADDVQMVRYQCSSRHLNSAFFPVIKYFEGALGIDVDADSNEEKLTKLSQSADALVKDNAQALSLFANLLGVEQGEDSAISTLSAAERRAATIKLLIDYILSKAEQGPVVFFVEDAHWIDPSTQQVIESVIAQSAEQPLLTLITSRLTSRLNLNEELTYQNILLSDLGSEHIEQLVRETDQANVLSEAEIVTIVDRAEGVPLFAEEITTAAIEQESRGEQIAIPESIEASIAARLDHLGNAKTIVQIASVIGREFKLGQLEPLAKLPENSVLGAMAIAIASGLNKEVQVLGDRAFRFMHALIQDVAYNGLLKSQRREFHKAFADLLSQETLGQNTPELVAFHLTKAGDTARAIEQWRVAGAQATAASATAEAISHYQDGLKLIPDLPSDKARNKLEFSLWVGMAMPLIVESGYTSDDLKSCIQNALDLSDSEDHNPNIYQLLYSQWGFQLTFGQVGESEKTANKFAELAAKQRDDVALFAANRMLGATHMCQGKFAQANSELNTLINDYVPAEHSALAAVYGVDLKVAGRCFLSEVLWAQGQFKAAQKMAALAYDEALELNHLQSLAISIHFNSVIAYLIRDRATVIKFTEEMLDLERKQAVGTWPTTARSMLGWAKLNNDEFDENMTLMEQGANTAAQLGVAMFIPFFYARIAEELMANAQLDKANDYLTRAEELAERTGDVIYLAEITQLRAQHHNHLGNSEQAQTSFERALDIAKQQSSVALQLSVGLAFFEHDQAQGTQVLRDALQQFPPDEQSEELDKARAILA